MTDLLRCQLNLKFDYDWQRVRRVYKKILEKKEQGSYGYSYENSYEANTYSLSSYGSIIASTCLTDHVWDVWAGQFLEYVLPKDIYTISESLKAANLNFVNFGFFTHYGNIKPHIDGMVGDNGKYGHCNINYIVSSSDPNATTYLRDSETGIIENYKATPGQTWLLNSATEHWVENTGVREIFQIKVFSPFAQVKQFFADNNLLCK